jgi:hypothetical protein
MADDEYSASVYMEQGGAALRVKSGGQIETGEVADKNTLGGIVILHRFDIADTAGTDNADESLTLEHKTRILDAWVVKTDAAQGNNAASVVTVKDGSNSITDDIDIQNAGDKSIKRAGEIDDAYHEIAAGGTLQVVVTKGNASDNIACEVYVLAIRVA